ncbi:MAG: hypothetical protein QXT78_02280 [Candidatus Nitrosocaldus sp.]
MVVIDNSTHDIGIGRSNGSIALTYSPYTKKIYIGSLAAEDFRRDSHLIPLLKVNHEKRLGEGRHEVLYAEYIRQAERHLNAGVLDTPQVQSIIAVQVLDMIIGEQYRQYYLQEGTTRVPVPKLQLRVPIARKYSASEKVPPMQEPQVLNTTFDMVEFNLWKNVVSLAVEDEARLRPAFDPLASQIRTAASSLGRAVAKQIAEELLTYGDAAKGSWSALNSSDTFSARNPLDDIAEEYSRIADDGFEPDTVVMHPRTWAAYQSNTHVKGYTVLTPERLGLGVFPLPGWPGITAIVDSMFTTGQCALYDRKTFLLGEGPTVVEEARDHDRGLDKYIIRQWVQPLKTAGEAGIRLVDL